MEKSQIIKECYKALPKFTEILQDEAYQLRGILNSEALLIIAIAEHFNTKHIIESGRARGHSTNLLAKYFENTDTKITSIDLDKHSKDAKYSERYLQKYPNLNLIYGNAFEKVPENIKDDCIVFIDGPKGEDALELTSQLLQNHHVKAVLIHDLHKNVFPRNIAELIYTDWFFSDDDDFVKSFRQVDEDCWKVMEGTGYSPFKRAGTDVLSYGHTLGVIFNNQTPFKEPEHTNYTERRIYTKQTIPKILVESFFSLLNKIRLLF